ncbi:MAG: sulfotransferase [Candidatus Omnitrophica bacterium]|nr:sulfotransferase [Candidatus Omnitrophota bacterium]
MGNHFKFLMLGAMYENGGNTTHRFLDGHPQMFVYPFESQLGTKLVNDSLSSLFPLKYRWPVFPLDGSAYGDYKLIIDEEGKVRARTPHVSKFRHMPFDFNDDERCEIYQKYIEKSGRSRAANMEAFFRSTFDAWKDYNRSGKEEFFVGYSPVLVVDANKILDEIPGAHFLHVVRNPWSAYADTKKRPVPLSLENYITCWNINQYFALLYQKKYPGRMHIVRIEDVLEDSYRALGDLCKKIGLQPADSLKEVSWNGKVLEEVYPWGTIRKATPEANLNTALELSSDEQAEIKERSWQYLEEFNYSEFLLQVR